MNDSGLFRLGFCGGFQEIESQTFCRHIKEKQKKSKSVHNCLRKIRKIKKMLNMACQILVCRIHFNVFSTFTRFRHLLLTFFFLLPSITINTDMIHAMNNNKIMGALLYNK